MAVKPIVPIGHPILRQEAEPIAPADVGSDRVQGLIDDLIDTMRAANGAGIAANQIGVARAVATIEVTSNERYPYKPAIPLTVIINPVIEPLDDESVVINEGCLSVPLRGELTRAVNVQVTYLDRDGDRHQEIKRGLTAGTFQHEVDHLNGRLIVDHIDPVTLTTWEQFQEHHQAAFVERIEDFVRRVGS